MMRDYWRFFALVLLACTLQGCIGTTVREFHYDIDIHNATDRAVALELLQAKSSNINRLRADLAPGGSFANTYTFRGEAEYLEARLRPLDAQAQDAWFIRELPTGVVRYDVQVQDNALVLVPRKPKPVVDHP